MNWSWSTTAVGVLGAEHRAVRDLVGEKAGQIEDIEIRAAVDVAEAEWKIGLGVPLCQRMRRRCKKGSCSLCRMMNTLWGDETFDEIQMCCAVQLFPALISVSPAVHAPSQAPPAAPAVPFGVPGAVDAASAVVPLAVFSVENAAHPE